jgi:hypothetical protein
MQPACGRRGADAQAGREVIEVARRRFAPEGLGAEGRGVAWASTAHRADGADCNFIDPRGGQSGEGDGAVGGGENGPGGFASQAVKDLVSCGVGHAHPERFCRRSRYVSNCQTWWRVAGRWRHRNHTAMKC